MYESKREKIKNELEKKIKENENFMTSQELQDVAVAEISLICNATPKMVLDVLNNVKIVKRITGDNNVK